MILPALVTFPNPVAQECFLSALNGLCGDTEKMLTYARIHTSSPYTHFHTVTAKDRFLANNSPNVTFPLCSVAMAAINCSEVFMCRTNSAKELIVLAHSKQSYRLCTLTPLIASVTHCYLRAELRLRGILAKPLPLKDI